MRFADPLFFILIIIVPLLVFSYLYEKKKKKASIRFSDLSVIKNLPSSRLQGFRWILFALRIATVLILIICIARPQSGKKCEEILTEGIDIILALDISGSMRAEDFKPKNRLMSAKQVVEEFVKGRKNDRLGLIVFAAHSFTQCPLTLDYGVLLNFLKQVKIGMIEDGTAIGMALVNCVNRLKNSKAKSKVIILLTDGVNNTGKIDPITAAKIARAMDVKVYTIGMGKIGGAPIPIEHPIFGKIYARNPDGSLVLTKVDEHTLKEIARITKGKYFRATDEKKLRKICAEIDKMEKTKIKVKEYMKYKELFAFPLFIGIILLLTEITLANTRFRKLP
jgi:Ca-activated chloride channel family protein